MRSSPELAIVGRQRGAEHSGVAGWLALAAVLGLGSVLVRWVEPSLLDWQPGSVGSAPWRAWTGALVHWSDLHLAANLAGLALVAAFGWAAAVPARVAWVWFIAWPLTQAGLLARPDLLHYGGLSGTLHAGLAAAALFLALHGRGRRRLVGVATLLVLCGKVLSEAPWGAPLVFRPDWDIAIAPAAHAAGLVAGLAVGLAFEAWAARTPRSIGRHA